MDLYPSQEQRDLASAVREVLAGRASGGGGAAPERVWRAAAAQGWFALGLAGADGGLDGTLADEAQVFAGIGAAAAEGPFLATVLAARVAVAAGRRELAEALTSGTLRAAHAFAPLDGSDPVQAYDARGAGVLLLIDEERPGARLVEVPGSAIVADLSSMDPAVSVARLRLDRARVLAEAADAGTVVSRASVLVSAMLAGVAAAATQASVEYAKLREQFGRPIGAFQAISHRCAEMAIRSAAAAAVVDLAAVSVDECRADAPRRVAAARRFTESAALENARVNIQNHGAIGFTWEHDAHRLLKRAWFLALSVQPRDAQTAALLAG
ncbi:acyl-CoA dehydrogenase family protein [Phytohabitans suffuscus]|uniref:Acyl-CoA dehydrogenase/oxidase C-terminal domain-containing protein n=1 Tax=Phytohabitans suffuscus TaxID=624315 RepID=A0A6F8YCJ8_9ACTN|nr:acyl-CoA dehydrogenase family protein [Phytohabitans suffuscus]BCB83787.1 hypothetical protein Psuf_011000 [Phytohabitans suffuscus]